MKDKERQALVLNLWLQRPADKRTSHELLVFYGELERNHPELLNRRHGDPYQQLKVDLRGYVTF